MRTKLTLIVLGLMTVGMIGCESGPPEYRGASTWTPRLAHCDHCPEPAAQQPTFHEAQTPVYQEPVYQEPAYQSFESHQPEPQEQVYISEPTWHLPKMKTDRKCPPCEEYRWVWVDGHHHCGDCAEEHDHIDGCASCRGRYVRYE